MFSVLICRGLNHAQINQRLNFWRGHGDTMAAHCLFLGLIMKIGDYITTTIHGRKVKALVVAIHGAGTIDIETKYGFFRIAGLRG